MADEAVQEAAVNSGGVADSAPVTDQNAVANPPAESNSAANVTDNRIPYDRFNSVIQERNSLREQEQKLRSEYENRIKELESRLPNSASANDANHIKRLVDNLGMSEAAARELVESQRAIAHSAKQEIESKMRVYEINEWQRNLSEKHKDFRELMPDMEKAFSALPPEAQNLVVSSPKGLELFYKSVRAEAMEKRAGDAYKSGANDAYAGKAQKQAMTSVPGGAAKAGNAPLSAKAIEAMTTEEYARRLPEINAWVAERSRR